jgi:hypothetical protein
LCSSCCSICKGGIVSRREERGREGRGRRRERGRKEDKEGSREEREGGRKEGRKEERRTFPQATDIQGKLGSAVTAFAWILLA